MKSDSLVVRQLSLRLPAYCRLYQTCPSLPIRSSDCVAQTWRFWSGLNLVPPVKDSPANEAAQAVVGDGFTSSVHHVRNHADIPPWGIHPLVEGSLEEAGRTAADHWHKGRGEEGSRVGTGHRSDREEGEEDSPPLVGGVVIDSELGHHSSLVVGFGHGSRIRRGEDYSREEDHGVRSHPREVGTVVVPESGIDHDRVRERQAECQQHIGRAVP